MKVYVLAAASIVLTACGSDPADSTGGTSMANAHLEATVDTDKAPASTARSSGEGQGRAAPAPDIAYGVAHYPDGRRVGVSQDFSLEQGKNPMWYQYETSDEPAQVLAFYKTEAAKAGYAISSEKTREIWREISLKSARPGGGVMNVTTLGDKGKDLLIDVHISEDD